MVGLGDCLNMFSDGGQTRPNRATGPLTSATTRVVIAAPTSPRLKFLLKECLSISKWAMSLFKILFAESVFTVFVRKHRRVGKLRVTFLGEAWKKRI